MNIAIISTNKDKYSETFIHNHVQLLSGNIHFLFDGYLPKKYSIDKGESEHLISEYNNRKWYQLFKPRYRNDKDRLIDAVQQYLKNNKIDVVLCEYGPSGVELMNIVDFLKIPLIVHFHGYDAYRNDILSSYGRLYKKMFSICSVVISVSQHMTSQLTMMGCPSHKIKMLCYGIDTELFKKHRIPSNDFTYVACGRFVEKKSPFNTIKAFNLVLKKHPQAKLVMIGDGELLQNSKNLASQLNMNHAIEFKGAMTQLQIAHIFSKSNVFVQHSITTTQNDSEGTPLTILEAMCAGLPVVSTKHAGIMDVVKDNESGFLVNEGDIKAMAERMIYFIENKEIAMLLGENGSEIINSTYNLHFYTQSLMQILKQQKK